jgi:hypothetical protein
MTAALFRSTVSWHCRATGRHRMLSFVHGSCRSSQGLHVAPRRSAPPHTATRRSAPLRNATSIVGCFRMTREWHCFAPQRSAARHCATPRIAAPRIASPHIAARHGAPHHNATQRLTSAPLCLASPRSATLHSVPLRFAPHRATAQRNVFPSPPNNPANRINYRDLRPLENN